MKIHHFGKPLRVVALCATILATLAVGAEGAAATGSAPTPRLQAADSCTSRVTEAGFTVTWQSTIDVDGFIVERRSLNRFWWRGRVDSQAATFTDGPAPAGAASMEYRVVARTNQGDIVATIPCPLQPTDGFACIATELFNGGYRVKWAGRSTTDAVVRRSVTPGGPAHWRAVTTGSQYIDAPSATGQANYEVYGRTNNQISAYAVCSEGVAGEPCSAGVTDLPAIECAAMLELNDRGLGEEPTTDPCLWQAITCTNGRVTEIKVNRLIKGTIPPELGDLEKLEELDLQSDLTGPIPQEISNLASLRRLVLISADLTGPIPPELRRLLNLEELTLRGGFSGEIPVELAELAKLTRLSLRGKNLSGAIPVELSDLAQLRYLILDFASLTGEIPPELAKLTNLKELRLGPNQLTGQIPPELGQLNGLRYLDLSGNKLTGSIPSELGNLLVLRYLRLEYNALTGPIPGELGNLKGLEGLYLQNNQLSGAIPSELGGLDKVVSFLLDNNELTGTLPDELANLDTALRFYVSDNHLTGDITDVFAALMGTVKLIWLSDGLGGTNCFTATDPAVVAWLDAEDPDWAECE